MDANRFDALTRTFSSRRTALGGVVGGLVAAVLGQTRPEDASAHNPLAACRRITSRQRRTACIRRARRHNAQHRLQPTPPPPDQCAGRNVCTQGSAAACGAAGNQCYCWVTPAGASVCGGNDGAYGADNCDVCTRAGRICVVGGGINCDGPVACVLPCCPPGYRECGGRCVDVLRDSANCGNCGQDCGIDRPNICAGGSCCLDAGGGGICHCAPSGSACAAVGNARCCSGTCTNGVCPEGPCRHHWSWRGTRSSPVLRALVPYSYSGGGSHPPASRPLPSPTALVPPAP